MHLTPSIPKQLPDMLADVAGGSASNYDLKHVSSLVETIASVAGDYVAGSVCLHGMTLPFKDPSHAHDGYMEFRVSKEGFAPIAFGVEFGGVEHARLGFGPLTLSALKEAAGAGDTDNDMATVLNFDELWLFANLLTQRLAFSTISIAFGGLGGL